MLVDSKVAARDSMESLENSLAEQNVHSELQTLASKWKGFKSQLTAIAEALDELEHKRARGQLFFKPSVAKKVADLSPLATNLQIHDTFVKFKASPQPVQFEVSSVTFGAPTSAKLGYAHGGLANIAQRMSNPRHSSRLQSPTAKDELERMKLDLEYTMRKWFCTSQFVAAVTAAVVHKLKFVVENKLEDQLRQYVDIGILVHMISLLSTQGHEDGMIADFSHTSRMMSIRFSLQRNQSAQEGAGRIVNVFKEARFVSADRGVSDDSMNIQVVLAWPAEQYDWAVTVVGDNPSIASHNALFTLG